jgi:hypothetical protein
MSNPPRRHRTLIIGLVAAALVLMLEIGVGVLVVLPTFTGDDKTSAGAKAAAGHGLDLLRAGDYIRYYNLLDSASKASISGEAWIATATCINFSQLLTTNHISISHVALTGDRATVDTTGNSAGYANLRLLLRYESRHWRFHEAGHYYIPSGARCGG